MLQRSNGTKLQNVDSVDGVQVVAVSMVELRELTAAIERGDRDAAKRLTTQAIAEQLVPQQILDAMVGGMDTIGQKFQLHEIFVPEMLIAARAMKESMALLEPLLVESGYQPIGRVVIGTVEGDLHDIGKNLVTMMWRSARVEVVDLGANVSPQKFLDAVRTHQPQVVGMSALLTTTMPAMQRTIDVLRELGDSIPKIVIGGAPVTQQFADLIGADGYAPDAASAVPLLRGLLVADSGTV